MIQLDTELKRKLTARELTIGSWITIGHPSVAEIMLSADFDWLCIDMEHSVTEFSTAQQLIQIITSAGKAALVRVSKNEEVAIKKVMDAGATGVIVPMVNSRQDAVQAVNYVKYPPAGKRGVGLARAQSYGTGFDAYKDWVKESSVVIAQIEHIDAVNNLEEILDVPGIDGIMIGPYDLSGSMGFPGEYHREEVKAAIAKVEQICKQKKKSLGFHVIPADASALQEKIDAGFRFLAFSLDFYFLGDAARGQMQQVRKQNAV